MKHSRWRELALIVTLSLAACKTSPTVVDSSMSAMASGDATALISGCGSQPIVGYAYCRVGEGAATNQQAVTFYGPPASCKEGPCTSILIFSPTGDPTYSVSIARDKTAVSVPLSDLTHKPAFEKLDRGYWPFVTKTRWTDDQGLEHETTQEGEIRLRVLSASYVPLNEAKDNPAFGWEWVDAGHTFKMSTAGRAHVD